MTNDSELFIFGFIKMKPKLVKVKEEFFKFVEIYYEHLKVSIQFGVTKESTILKNYLMGVKHTLYREGKTRKQTAKILRKLKKLCKQVYRQLSNYDMLDCLSEYTFKNATEISLFALQRKKKVKH